MVRPTMECVVISQERPYKDGAPHHEMYYHFARAVFKYGAPHHGYTNLQYQPSYVSAFLFI